MPAPSQTVAAPLEYEWKSRPGDDVAHAFSRGPGFMRSVCRAERWTVLLDAEGDHHVRCGDCSLLLDGAPGEITEAFGR
jgi:hypothetical protein